MKPCSPISKSAQTESRRNDMPNQHQQKAISYERVSKKNKKYIQHAGRHQQGKSAGAEQQLLEHNHSFTSEPNRALRHTDPAPHATLTQTAAGQSTPGPPRSSGRPGPLTCLRLGPLRPVVQQERTAAAVQAGHTRCRHRNGLPASAAAFWRRAAWRWRPARLGRTRLTVRVGRVWNTATYGGGWTARS